MKSTIFSENKELYSVQRLIEELHKQKHIVELVHPFDSTFALAGNASNKTHNADYIFNRISGVRFDDYDLNLQKKYEKNGSKSINSTKSLKALRDKTDQLEILNELGAPIISTLYFRGKPNRESLLNNLANINAKDEFIVKTQRGNQGIGVNLLRGIDSLLAFLETFWAMKDQRLIIQPMLKFEKEIRLFMIKDELISGIEKTLNYENDFRANSEKADSKILNTETLDSSILPMAKKLMKELGLFYAGFDFAITITGEVKLLEVNPCPGFEVLEKLTSKNIAEQIVLRL